MRTLSIDIETYSSVDLSEAGVYKYAEDPDFQVLLIGYSFDGGPVEVWDCTDPLRTAPVDFRKALTDPDVLKTAWNANFERTTIGKYFGRYCEPSQWFDPMVMASCCGLPAKLETAGAALGLSEDQAKMKIGKQLIREFSLPCKPTKKNGMRERNLPEHDPENWALYKSYNQRDVEAEMAICKRLLRWRPMRSEQKLWALDQRINDLGIRVDTTMAANAIRIGGDYKQRLIDRAAELSGLENPNSTAQVKAWLEEQEGITVSSLNKRVIADVVAGLSEHNSIEFMALRTEFSKSSVKKYEAITRAVCQDQHVHGCFQFAGAGRTGRWAGRLVQLQNLPQNHLEDLDVAREIVADGDGETLELLYPNVQGTLSELIRTALIPEEGHRFIVADYSAIEARVLAWLCGEQWRLDVFEQGGDIYCASASQMFKVPVEKHGINGHLRQKGKVAVLACGYQGGVGAMRAMDKGGTIPDEELQSVVDQWRAANPKIVKMWRSYERAARTAIEERRTVKLRNGVAYSYESGNLFARLPNGRKLCYYGARLKDDRIYYMGVNQETKQWGLAETYGGKLVENVVQATARDCLAEAMTRVAAMGYQIVMHVHDEMIVDVPKEDTDALQRINAAMGAPIEWAPGLPLRGDGYECDFYKKD